MEEVQYKVGFAKFCCGLICGKKINSVTWTNWKSAVHIKAGRYEQDLTTKQFNLLCAIAYIRMQDQQSDTRTKLAYDVVTANIQPARELLAILIKPYSAKMKLEGLKEPEVIVLGSEIPSYLEKNGLKRVSMSTLRRRINGFSINQTYRIAEILAVAV